MRHNSHNSMSDVSSSKYEDIVRYLYKQCRKGLESTSLTKINGGYYYFYTDSSGIRMNWFNARNWCAARGMQLVNLETEKENRAVKAYLGMLIANEAGSGANQWWTGGNDQGLNGQYFWLTGYPFAYSDWQTANGAPPALAGDACITLHKTATILAWNEVDCTTTRRFICELRNPCSNIFRIYQSLNSDKSSSSSSSDYDSTAIHRRHSSSDSDSNSSDEKVIVIHKPDLISNIGNHIKDKIETIGDFLGNKENMIPQIVFQKQSKKSSSSSENRSSASRNSASRSSASRSSASRSSASSNSGNRSSRSRSDESASFSNIGSISLSESSSASQNSASSNSASQSSASSRSSRSDASTSFSNIGSISLSTSSRSSGDSSNDSS